MDVAEKLQSLKLRTKLGWQLRRSLVRISGAGCDMSDQVAVLSGILRSELESPLGCDDYVRDLRALIEGVSSAEYTEVGSMNWISKGLNELREKMEWETSQRLVDALGVALQEDLPADAPPLGGRLRALHQDAVVKAFTAIINGNVLPGHFAQDNAQILEFLKELTGELR